MFNFDRSEEGAFERHQERKLNFKRAFNRLPLVRYYIWWLIHNCIAHPLIGLFPFTKLTFAFHDWTSQHMHPKMRRHKQ